MNGRWRGNVRVRHGRRHSSAAPGIRSEEHTSELQSRSDLVCRLLLEKKKKELRHHRPEFDGLPNQTNFPLSQHLDSSGDRAEHFVVATDVRFLPYGVVTSAELAMTAR